MSETLKGLIDGWRSRANGVIETVNHGQAPPYEADRAKGWIDCADELEAALLATPEGAPEPPGASPGETEDK